MTIGWTYSSRPAINQFAAIVDDVQFIQHVSWLETPVVGGTPDTVHEDAAAIVQWRIGSSQPTRAC